MSRCVSTSSTRSHTKSALGVGRNRQKNLRVGGPDPQQTCPRYGSVAVHQRRREFYPLTRVSLLPPLKAEVKTCRGSVNGILAIEEVIVDAHAHAQNVCFFRGAVEFQADGSGGRVILRPEDIEFDG